MLDLETSWTPKIVGDRLVAAGRWIQLSGRPVGPRAPVSQNFGFISDVLDPDEFAREFGGVREIADPDDIRPPRFKVSPRRVAEHEAALCWPSQYLADPQHEGCGRVLKVWLRCKIVRRPFDATCKARGWSRATAYRLQERALGIIATGLTRDRVPVE